jgi:hypothetical protein
LLQLLVYIILLFQNASSFLHWHPLLFPRGRVQPVLQHWCLITPTHLGFDRSQGFGFQLEPDVESTDSLSSGVNTLSFLPSSLIAECTGCHAYSAAANKADPNTLNWDQAIADTEHQEAWLDAAKLELDALTKQGTWDIVPKSDATSTILPGTWVFQRK